MAEKEKFITNLMGSVKCRVLLDHMIAAMQLSKLRNPAFEHLCFTGG